MSSMQTRRLKPGWLARGRGLGLVWLRRRCEEMNRNGMMAMVFMHRHTAHALVEGGEGLNLCIWTVLQAIEWMIGMGGEGLRPLYMDRDADICTHVRPG